MLNRTSKTIVAFLIAILFISIGTAEAADKVKKIKIKTPSVQCGMCKKTIEKALDKIEGVESADVNYKKKYATVTYNPELVTPDKIRKAISKAGYDADKVKANKKSYNKLPNCCKLPEDR